MKRIIVAILALLMLTGCGGKNIAVVGKEKITQGEFEFYLSSIKEQMQGTELQTDEDWETQEIEGKKAIDVAKQRAIDIAVNNVEYCEVAKLASLELSDEEEKMAAATKTRIVASHGGEKGYKQYLKDSGITDDFIDMMCRSTIYFNKISGYVEEKVPITEEALKNRFESYKSGSGYLKAKHILFLTVEPQTMTPLSEDKIAQAKIRADEVYNRIRAGADFDSLMFEYSQDPGLKENPDGYVFKADSGEMMPEFEQAVKNTPSFKPDEITMTETDYGYHIIRREQIEFEDLKDRVKEVILEELVSHQISEWKAEYGFITTINEELLKKIK